MDSTREVAISLVDAIGEALGVDTGTVSEIIFEAAVEAAVNVLNARPADDSDEGDRP